MQQLSKCKIYKSRDSISTLIFCPKHTYKLLQEVLSLKKNTESIKNNIYPLVKSSLSNTRTMSAYKKMIGEFMTERTEDFYDIVPCSRIIYSSKDEDTFFKTLNISPSTVKSHIDKTYYGNLSNFNPRAAQDPLTVTALMVIRYFYMQNKKKETISASIYLAFSGSFYPSCHYSSFRFTPEQYRHILEYVVNNIMSNRYDLKVTGSIIGAVTSLINTWLKSYGSMLKTCSDEDCVYVIQQLRNRIKSFIKNIASEFYKVYKNKEGYLTYDSDDFSEENYRLVDNDSLKIERIVENSMNYITTNSTDIKLVNLCVDQNIKITELTAILDSVNKDTKNTLVIKDIIRVMVSQYMKNSKEKNVASIEFINYALAAKPNVKDKDVLKMKNDIETVLLDNAPAYKRRRNRPATKNSYYRAITCYYALIINKAAKM